MANLFNITTGTSIIINHNEILWFISVNTFYIKIRYYANSGGAIHIVKREAQADSEANSEADAESWYYGFGYPSAFQQQGYSGYPFYNNY